MSGNALVLGLDSQGNLIDFPASARARHLYAVGATRTGKSKFLESLIRQDILDWAYTECGVVLLDWHGTLCENILAWAAAENLSEWPIIPFELRRQDWCISYNLLRKRGIGDPAVIVNNFVRAMLHGWGQTNTNDTPRLGKWLRTILYTLYAGNFTLAEAKDLIANPATRRQMTAKIEDLIFQLKSQYTIVIVTHNMQQAARVAERTGFFLNGKLVEFDSTHKIFTNPGDKRTEDYITGRFG